VSTAPTPASTQSPLLLLIEEDAGTREGLRRAAAHRGFAVREAPTFAAGLELARELRPHAVLLDFQISGIDGLDMLARLRAYDEAASVVVISRHRDEQRMAEALALGAVNFLHKPLDANEIRFLLDRLFRTIREEADVRDVGSFVVDRTIRLVVPVDTEVLAKVVAYLGRELRAAYPTEAVAHNEVKLALYEALANALEHGNLEIGYDEKSAVMLEPGGLNRLIRERMADMRLGGRHIHVVAEHQVDRICYRIRDEGHGFDHVTQGAKPLVETSALHGRGITLIRHYMDEVSWNESGTEIRLCKYVGRVPEAE